MQDKDILEGSSDNQESTPSDTLLSTAPSDDQQSTPSDTLLSTAPSDDQQSSAQSSHSTANISSPQEYTSYLPQEGIDLNQQA